MKRLDTMQTTGPQTVDVLKLSNFPDSFVCGFILLHGSYPIEWEADTMFPGPTEFLPSMLGNFTLRFGPTRGEKVIYATTPGVEQYNVHRFVTRAEAPNNIDTLNGFEAGSGTVEIDLVIPFAVEPLKDGRLRLPGWSQMRSMILDIVEGPALDYGSGQIVRGAGNVLWDIDVFEYPSALDRWTPPLSYFRVNQAALYGDCPDGALLSIWEISAAQINTAIDLFSVSVGELKPADNVPPYVAADKYKLNWVAEENVDITDQVTMGFSPDEGQSTADLPSGFTRYTQASQYVPQLQLRGLFWPPLDVEDSMGALRKLSLEANVPILGALPLDAHAYPSTVARTLPIDAHPAGTPEFTLRQGLVAPQPGSTPFAFIPERVSALAAARVELAAAGGVNVAAAGQSQVLQEITASIPGLAAITASQKPQPVDPAKFARALATVQGEKGKQSADLLLRSVKVSS